MNPKPLTNKQKHILSLLLEYRFITVTHLLKYFNHKDPKRIKEWLKDLKLRKLIDRTKYKDVTKPIIYCLAQGARSFFKDNKDIDITFLDRLYKEEKLSEEFKQHCLFLFDVHLYFLKNKTKDSKLAFCTKQDLTGFDYLPEDIDAYMAVENKKGTKRYFIEFFGDYQNKQSPGKTRFALRKYLKFCEEGTWQANTKNSPFPTLLFVLKDDRRKAHIFHYGKAKLAKSFEDISLFLTTQDAIKFSKGNTNIWQEVK